MNKPHAIVAGAGIAGLVAALDLASRGLAVTVLECSNQHGGKMSEVEIQGRHIDSGPTVFTMPWVFEEIFADAGTDLGEYLELEPMDRLARHVWCDGEKLDLFADRERTVAAIKAFAGPGEAQRFRSFSDQAQQVFDTLYHPFMRNQRPSLWSLIAASGVRGLGDLWRIRPFESLWQRLAKHFHDPRLRSLFARYATYCGASPFQAPATLMLIAHVEQCGVWRVVGGMQRLADALVSELQRKGGEIRYASPVREIGVRNGRVVGVCLETEQWLPADVIVANVDVASISSGMLGQAAASAIPGSASRQRSLSAVTWSLLAETSGFELAHHNVFFPDDYPSEFDQIFRLHQMPSNPAAYICAQDRSGEDERISGPERLFMIANAPPNGDCLEFDAGLMAAMESAVFDLLKECGLNLAAAPDRRIVTTPADFERRFPGTGGALYGMASHGWRSSFRRPGARTRLPGLYLAGGSVHPGPGVPMVAIGGRLAAAAAAEDLGLRPGR